jgi:iron complex transport system substrate-binding protein
MLAGTPARCAAAQRIVSLVPSVTETLFALGAGGEVAGVSSYDDYPPAATHLPRVGSFLTPNVEEIAALRPTLVIGPESSSNQRELRALVSMGYPTMLVEDDSVAQIEQSIRQIGERIGRGAQAEAIVNGIDGTIAEVSERLRGVPNRRVVMVVGHQPIVAVGRGTFLDDLLKIAHADNIADSSGEQWPHLSLEYIVAMRPDVILDGQMGSDPQSPSHFWDPYAMVPAVREHRVYGYPENPTLHPGPRIGTTLKTLARLIHPEAFDVEHARRDEAR